LATVDIHTLLVLQEPFFLVGPEARALLANATPDAAVSFQRHYVDTCFNTSILAAHPDAITSEASTSYFHSTLAFGALDALTNLNNTKIIVSFREPVARA
jgi:hypothetical protein